MTRKVYHPSHLKDLFDVKPFKNYFVCYGTINGMDYSFPGETEEYAWLLAEAWLTKTGHFMEKCLLEEKLNVERAYKRQMEEKEKEMNEQTRTICQHHTSQLMSVFYLLDTLSNVGTHKEKATVIMALKSTIEKLVVKGDRLAISFGPEDDLPF